MRKSDVNENLKKPSNTLHAFFSSTEINCSGFPFLDQLRPNATVVTKSSLTCAGIMFIIIIK